MVYLTGEKIAQVLLISIIIIFCLCTPALADIPVSTSTKVFFEKNGEPYNDSITFKVACYGYIVDISSSDDMKNYFGGNYERKKPGTYEQTEVFSYSATVDHYGDEIFEPFYIKYRVIDYCSLYGEIGGEEFFIENIGSDPRTNCTWRDSEVICKRDSDKCYLPTKEARRCYQNESMLSSQESDLCDQYLEKVDSEKTYPPDTQIWNLSGIPMVITQEYKDCIETARQIDLNCTYFMPEVTCENNCDPDRNPIERDCVLHYVIPTDENGNITRIKPDMTKAVPAPVTVFSNDPGTEVVPEESSDPITSSMTKAAPDSVTIFSNDTRTEVDPKESFDPISIILTFFGLV